MTQVVNVPVDWFAGEMRRVLGEPKNLAKSTWRNVADHDLLVAATKNLVCVFQAVSLRNHQDVIDRCADVANLCLMVADKANQTKPTEM